MDWQMINYARIILKRKNTQQNEIIFIVYNRHACLRYIDFFSSDTLDKTDQCQIFTLDTFKTMIILKKTNENMRGW